MVLARLPNPNPRTLAPFAAYVGGRALLRGELVALLLGTHGVGAVLVEWAQPVRPGLVRLGDNV